jgi:hypothetical protein
MAVVHGDLGGSQQPNKSANERENVVFVRTAYDASKVGTQEL